MTSPLYPFDPTGLAATNLAPAEIHTVTSASGPNLSFVVPRAAPFFGASIKVRNGTLSTSPLLVQGVDYILTHRYEEASIQTSKQIYGSISFLNRNFTGNIRIDPYQTVGGTWVLDDYTAVEMLTNSLYSIRTVLWDEVTGYPAAFPPYNHDHDADDLVGMSSVVAKLTDLIAAINASGPAISALATTLNQHLTAGTAHTKAQIGLPLVNNFDVATQAVAEAGAANNVYMTPLRVKQLITALGLASGSIGLNLTGDATGSGTLNNGGTTNLTVALAESIKLLDSNPFTTITDGTTAVDPNTSSESFFLTRHANCPDNAGTKYWFVFNFGHSTTGTVTRRGQMAVEYGTATTVGQRIAIRFMATTNSWSAWSWISNQQQNGTAGRAVTVTNPSEMNAVQNNIVYMTVTPSGGNVDVSALPGGTYYMQTIWKNGTDGVNTTSTPRIQMAWASNDTVPANGVMRTSEFLYYRIFDGTNYTNWMPMSGAARELGTINLNTIVWAPGNYDQRNAANITTLLALNYPVAANGRLVVMNSLASNVDAANDFVVRQYYYPENGLGVYMRRFVDPAGAAPGVWGAWVQIQADDGSVPVARLPTIPLSKGGLGSTDLAGAQAALQLKNGAFATLVVSDVAPSSPAANTFWFKPVV